VSMCVGFAGYDKLLHGDLRSSAQPVLYVTHGPDNFEFLTAATSLLFSDGSYIVIRKQFYCNMYVHS
jgi:hypothetical protein